ncbi:MAG: ferritin-like domain-containing protein [Pseudomonadota bacterium]|nr:ferritin-like domain-containing protein [Pseudomonadota bacterium]
MHPAHAEPATAVPLRCRALALWLEPDPATKVAQTRVLWAERDRHPLDPGQMGVDAASTPKPLQAPGRPVRPGLVAPRSVPSRTPFTLEGRAALLHSIAHIEFNAINLALDAIWRFDAMPTQFYVDWLQVAGEEALHFSLLREHLGTIGFDYGDFDAHDGLWLMTQRTADDVVARMALVPRTLEARGLDATPPLQAKFKQAGDPRAVEILAIILRDEIGHVAIGNRWYRWLCEQRALDPVAHYTLLAQRHQAPRPRPPFNHEARRAAGFTDEEVALLR